MKVIVTENYEEMSKVAADILIDVVKKNPCAVLGLATGSSPIGAYQNMAKDHKENGTSYKQVRTVNLDEYVGLTADHDQSYAYFMRTNLFNNIDIDLANTKNITNIWVGCHRVDGTLVWESDDEIGFYPWGPNEPSYVDGWDGVNEDYVMLWRLNGAWVYNDSRNDPIADYPGSYRGKIAFVCEFEN